MGFGIKGLLELVAEFHVATELSAKVTIGHEAVFLRADGLDNLLTELRELVIVPHVFLEATISGVERDPRPFQGPLNVLNINSRREAASSHNRCASHSVLGRSHTKLELPLVLLLPFVHLTAKSEVSSLCFLASPTYFLPVSCQDRWSDLINLTHRYVEYRLLSHQPLQLGDKRRWRVFCALWNISLRRSLEAFKWQEHGPIGEPAFNVPRL